MTLSSGAMEFQPALDRLVAEPAPLILRLWPLLGAALVAGLVITAAIVRVDVVVTAMGRLAADAPPVILQPMSPAVLRELLVKPGDRVVTGQLLARLDPTLPDADRAALEVQRRSLAAQVARLEADLAGRVLVGAGAEMALQAQVQSQRSGVAMAQRDQLLAMQVSLSQALAAENLAGPGLDDRLTIARQIEAMRGELASKGSGSHLAQLEAQVARIEAESGLQQHGARLQDLTQRLAQAGAQLAAFDSDQRRQMVEGLADIRPRLAAVEEQLTKADRLAALSDLRAPRPGVVLSVASGSPGSLMTGAAPVVVLLPTDVALIAEIGIRSSETGGIAAGDAVSIKVDAFPWRRNGMMTGRLDEVSSASFTPEASAIALHSGRVSLTSTLNLPDGAALLPGMTLTAEIKTGTRTVLDYFLDPLMRGVKESLREP